ncbi:MAG: fumarate hydratase subunit beta [Candidatus Saganbacteria bacterium]|uniref:Fumarate hydratase subunit beta n=1 Tax=Candidatus Saganbacteria bacterium TaxID=2575572 RepID=A0A833NXF7_UNCSA|nr:MAG: fumarate hydratase subunit beta [Candidatus Saganbacteria bacterium]
MKEISTPLDDKTIKSLKAGDQVLISGIVYVARDAAHQKGIPFDVKGQIIFYAGPTPGDPIGSIGPTTASRMDPFILPLLKKGLKATIGKGPRSEGVKKAHKKYKAVYFTATGGAAALLSKTVVRSEVIAYPELGAEAILKLEVVKFPAIVAYDSHGGDLFQKGRKKYSKLVTIRHSRGSGNPFNSLDAASSLPAGQAGAA